MDFTSVLNRTVTKKKAKKQNQSTMNLNYKVLSFLVLIAIVQLCVCRSISETASDSSEASLIDDEIQKFAFMFDISVHKLNLTKLAKADEVFKRFLSFSDLSEDGKEHAIVSVKSIKESYLLVNVLN